MTSINPLTAGIDIERSLAPKRRPTTALDANAATSTFGEFTNDVVNISQLGEKKLQQEKQLSTTRKIDDIAKEVIRVTSTIGKARSLGNLTNTQATELYNKIANLL